MVDGAQLVSHPEGEDQDRGGQEKSGPVAAPGHRGKQPGQVGPAVDDQARGQEVGGSQGDG